MAVTIEAIGLGKRYLLGEAFPNTVADAVRRIGRRRPTGRREIWALRDVSFEIEEGEVVGVIGRNGAGKSTLLKILARITDPTAGRARTRGRVGALLEVGTAFHMELTGRENIMINGALLGMKPALIRRRFDDIVDFSGVGAFLDTPLKRYSSGMYLRLAFAVAAHFEPEIVVVDEVLAVGDAEFQRRCLGRMAELGEQGRTVMFVSHDLGAIGRLCKRAIWIEQGAIRDDGPAADVIARYYAQAVPRAGSRVLSNGAGAGTDPVVLRAVAITDPSGVECDVLARGEPFGVRLELEVREPIVGCEVAVWIVNEHGVRVIDEGLFDEPQFAGSLDGRGIHEVLLRVPPVLPSGEFTLGAWLGSQAGTLSDEDLLRFRIHPRTGDRSEMGRRTRAASPSALWSVRSEDFA